MKRISISLSILTITIVSIFAQVPQSFNYQAVARDKSGNVLADQNVAFQISIIKDSIDGISVYSETHSKNTNEHGLVNLIIGRGITSDDFTSINWSDADYYVQIQMDESGGTNYQLFGTSQLLSVPYAMHAKTVEESSNLTISASQVFSGNGVSNWTTLDLSSFIGNNYALVILRITNLNVSDTDRYIFKQKGDTKVYQFANDPGIGYCALNEGASGQVIAYTDSNGIIEWMSLNSLECTIQLVAYIK